MTKLTPNFDVKEFKCHNDVRYPTIWLVDRLEILCEQLEKIRALTNQSMKINSGYRTPAYNAKIGGASKSFHCEGVAIDITLKGMTSLQLYNAIGKLIKDKEIIDGGLGLYKSWVHYDIRTILKAKPARWIGV